MTDRFRGCLTGLAVGDAVGNTLEFTPRDFVEPIDDMIGGGPFDLAAGQWTDDTSMALCLAASLVQCRGFDAEDQMRRYWMWYSCGYMSSTGRCFDIGMTTSTALHTFHKSGEPYAGIDDPNLAGNGSLMRLAPVPMFYSADVRRAREHASWSSKTTHGATECVECCEILAELLHRALSGLPRDALLEPVYGNWSTDGVRAIAEHDYLSKDSDSIRGTGYAVESLEAALWSFHATDSYRDAILVAANLGDDADTTAAICGQIAGAHYGYAAIPSDWRDKLWMHDEIVALSDLLADGR